MNIGIGGSYLIPILHFFSTQTTVCSAALFLLKAEKSLLKMTTHSKFKFRSSSKKKNSASRRESKKRDGRIQRSEVDGKSTNKENMTMKKKVMIFFVLCCLFSMIMNLYNKKVLNVFPYSWFLSATSLAAGSILMITCWTLRIIDAPRTDFKFWLSLFPVALAHTIGHVAATTSVSKVSVSFSQIIRGGEPACSVFMSSFFLGESYSLAVYLSLVPIIGGCSLSALTELDFNMTGFLCAMTANFAFVGRNILSKQGMKGKSISGMNYYGCLSILSLIILIPTAIVNEDSNIFTTGWEIAYSKTGYGFLGWIVMQSVFYHLSNQVAYMSLEDITPLALSILNTAKRITIIVSSIIIFKTPITVVNALGALTTILGTFFYSQVKI